jgi:two-component system, OmpR family, response regulator
MMDVGDFAHGCALTMLLYLVDPESTSAASRDVAGPDAPPSPSDVLLGRVREIARGIEGRVRHALNPTDAPITQLRILVVDDHPDSADSLAAVLELLGCPVRSCYDGASALAVAAEFEPHVCLLDLMMPTMDGLELAAHLKARAGSRPLLLIATTALGDWEARTRTALAGFHHHLTKPINIQAMVEAITRLGEAIGRQPDQPPHH